MATVLLIEDEEVLRRSLATYLRNSGYSVYEAENGEVAIAALDALVVDVVVADLRLSGVDGLTVLREVKRRDVNLPVIMMTACGDIEPAVAAMKAGAYDYLSKPFEPAELQRRIANALQIYTLRRELAAREAERSRHFKYLVTQSPKMLTALALAERLSQTPHTAALIIGETGTGKEVLGREIHYRSDRRGGPFVTVNCSSLPEALIESELFGYVRGAFTGATREKRGLFESASGGTIFLDEIGDMKLTLQPALLRVLEERTVRRVGGVADIPVDVRVIAATNCDLASRVAAGLFREDLFYRLNVFTIHIPPLRERAEDILPLARYFLAVFSEEFKKDIAGLTEDAEAALVSYSWPGNVRELRNVIERAVILAPGREIDARVLNIVPPVAAAAGETRWELLPLAEVEKRHITRVLAAVAGNKTRAAAALGISRTTLWAKLKEYGLEQ